MNKVLLFAAMSSLALFSCSGNDKEMDQDNQTNRDTVITETGSLEKNGIRLVALEGSPQFDGASLQLDTPVEGGSTNSTQPVFQFKVENFELGGQTEDKSGFNLANSGMGQHIHIIVDNQPYTAHYHDTAQRELEEGQHLMLAFLSRSYHESVKDPSAYVLRSFHTGEPDGSTYDLKEPLLFYSRPKGSYKGEEIKNLLLDFYPVNATIGSDYHVKVIIDGTEFILDEWKPYVVQGLEPGDHTFRIQLLDKEGNLVTGKFTDSGDRTVQLLAS